MMRRSSLSGATVLVNLTGLQMMDNDGGQVLFNASFSGSSPGFSFGAFFVPLNQDFDFNLTLQSPNTPPLFKRLGHLDVTGRAIAAFMLPAARHSRTCVDDVRRS